MSALKSAVDRSLYWATVFLFALLVVVVIWQVFARQVLDSPAVWTDEAVRMTFVWLGLFASAMVFGERGHIAMEFLVRRFSEPVQKVFALTAQAAVLLFALIVMGWGGYRASLNAWELGLSVLPFSFGQMYLVLPISGVLIAFYSLYHLKELALGRAALYPDNFEEPVPASATESRTGSLKEG